MNQKHIICSIGPASYSPEVLKKLIQSGMTHARLNFSHGSHQQYLEVIQNIKKIDKELGTNTLILQDLQGPKIRLGLITPGPLPIAQNEEIILDTQITESINGPIKTLPVQYKKITQDIQPGEIVYIDDGQLKLEAIKTTETQVTLKALNEWVLKSNKGINLPDTSISLPSLCKKDIEDLKFGLQHGVDIVALSFVRHPENITQLKQIIQTNLPNNKKAPQVMSKIERQEAIQNLDQIVNLTDSVMIARGDLGIECGMENLGKLQNQITKKCLVKNKPVYVATHLLKNMVSSPTPSRAEANDVYSSIQSGATGLLLSNETSVGKYPVEATQFIAKVQNHNKL